MAQENNPAIVSNDVSFQNNMHQLFYSIVITFVTTIFVYFVMYIIFGWGEGMLVNNCRR